MKNGYESRGTRNQESCIIVPGNFQTVILLTMESIVYQSYVYN
jgi:hypothetical protein